MVGAGSTHAVQAPVAVEAFQQQTLIQSTQQQTCDQGVHTVSTSHIRQLRQRGVRSLAQVHTVVAEPKANPSGLAVGPLCSHMTLEGNCSIPFGGNCVNLHIPRKLYLSFKFSKLLA